MSEYKLPSEYNFGPYIYVIRTSNLILFRKTVRTKYECVLKNIGLKILVDTSPL